MTDPPTVGLFHALETIEDFLDPLSLSFEDLCDELTGGWMFGYAEALRTAGVRTVVFCVRRDAVKPTRHEHRPTGATIWSVPEPRAHRMLRTGRDCLAARLPPDAPWRFPRIARAALSHGAHVLSTPMSALLPLLRAEGCGALLCQDYEYPRFEACLLMGRRIGIPVFASFQGGHRPQSFLERPLRPFAVRAAAGLVIAPQSEIDRVRKRYRVPADRTWRIFNPLEAARWEPDSQALARRELQLPADAEVVCWHGRVEIGTKGLDVLLDAWDQVTSERPHRRLLLLLVGTGRDAPALAERVAGRADVRWRNEYVLDKSEIRRYLSAADLYAFPSRSEGVPVAPVEAMACGLPVVAADAFGVADILEGGDQAGGIVVARGDAFAFANALCALLDDPRRREELGRRARQRVVEAFSTEAVGAQLRNALFPQPPPAARFGSAARFPSRGPDRRSAMAAAGRRQGQASLSLLWRIAQPGLWRLASIGDRHGVGWLIYNPALMRYYHEQALQDAPGVISSLRALFPGCHRYLDIGAGSGAFAAEAANQGLAVQACEHSRIGRLMVRRQGVDCRAFDLRRHPPAVLDGPFDLAYCLEVAEHVDEGLGMKLVRFAATQAPILVFTAAQPGQGGHGHVNEQPKSHWIERFAEVGLQHSEDLSVRLAAQFRRNAVVSDWLVENLMVFQRR